MPELIDFGTFTVNFLRDKHGTHGGLDVFELTTQPKGKMPIPHYHDAWDETIYGIEGVTTYVIDGVDQSALMLMGETYGRRDTAFIYSGDVLKAVVKEQFKLNVPGKGENPIAAKFYDLFRDTREEYPVSTEIGAWGGAEFVRIIKRHMMRKQKYPDEKHAKGRPNDGIENLRPESKAAVEAFLIKQSSPMR